MLEYREGRVRYWGPPLPSFAKGAGATVGVRQSVVRGVYPEDAPRRPRSGDETLGDQFASQLGRLARNLVGEFQQV